MAHPGSKRKGRTSILPMDPGDPMADADRPSPMTVAAILDWLDRWKVALAMGLGIALRLACCFGRRNYWMDEAALASNIERLTPIGMFGRLLGQQLAPPGFLVASWCLRQWFGPNPLVMRVIPLAAGIGGMFLFLALARRCLASRVVFPAVVMYASSNHLIYYASEFKQYATDIGSALACLWIGVTVGSKPLKWPQGVALASFGAVLVWFSHPAIFLLASVGLVGLGRAVKNKERRSAGLWLGVGLAWLVSFAGVHRVSTRQLAGSDQMWRFWGFAFPPWPLGSVWDATWIFRRLAYSFTNPLDFDGPFDPRLSLLPALGLAMVGAVRLWKSDRDRFALLFLPVVATLGASALRLYPFHGRLILFLAPIALIAIAAGLDAVLDLRGKIRKPLYYGLAAMVLVVPAITAVDRAFEGHWAHNYLGDLFPADVLPDRFPF